MASTNSSTRSRKDQSEEPELKVANPAQEAFGAIVNLINARVPLTGPERDQVGQLVNLVASELGIG